MTNLPSTARHTHRYDLDWLRVIAFGLLIFYHVGMFYVTWDWHVKSTHMSSALEPAMSLVNPWRLALLFFISGVALRFASEKAPLATFLPKRTLRLFIPIVFGMAVVVMPQAYVQLLYESGISGPIWPFYLDYLSFRQPFSIITPTWNHLWYVVYLMVYTLVLAPFFPVLRRLAAGPFERLCTIFERHPALLVILPAVPFFAYTQLLDPRFPTTHTLVDDWANHAHSLTIFIYGFVAGRSASFWRVVDRALPYAIGVALLIVLLFFAAREALVPGMSGATAYAIVVELRAFYAWAVIVTLLGLAQRWLDRPSSTLSYLTQAVFPYYILHQTIIVVVAYASLSWRLSFPAEASALIAATVTGCAVGYELIRRVPLLRPLFGLPMRDKARTAGRSASLAAARAK